MSSANSEANRRRWADPTYKARVNRKIREAIFNKYQEDPNYRKRVSQGTKLAMSEPGTKENHLTSVQKQDKPRWRANISEAITKAYQEGRLIHPLNPTNPNYKRNLEVYREANKNNGAYLKDPIKKEVALQKQRESYPSERRSIITKEVNNRPEKIAASRECKLHQWADPAWRVRTIRAILKASHIRPTSLELKIDEILQANFPGEWKYTGNGSVMIEDLPPDFVNINGKKAVIEANGQYWHQDLFEEPERINRYRQYGFNCLVIWENELLHPKKVLRKIKTFVRGIH